MSGQIVSVDCPAKTNLTLHVGERHEAWGGRHALDTMYCAVGVYDTVTLEQRADGAGCSLEISGQYLGDLAASSSDMLRNHAMLALFAMAQACGREPDVAVAIEKNIPVGAGLGGGSADAAGTLLGLNALWDLHWPLERLAPIAATLGADMPFCLVGGYAHGSGYGEIVASVAADDPRIAALRADGYDGRVLVGAYRAQLSTPEVYAAFDVLGGDGSPNDLQAAAVSLHPRSGVAIELATAAGATRAFVSGSGPSVCAFVPDDAAARAVERAWLDAQAVDRLFVAQAPVAPIVHAPEHRPDGAADGPAASA